MPHQTRLLSVAIVTLIAVPASAQVDLRDTDDVRSRCRRIRDCGAQRKRGKEIAQKAAATRWKT